MKFVLAIEKGDEGYWGFFPDVPGCITAGDDLGSVADNAVEALEGHLEGDTVPSARTLAEILADPEIGSDLDGLEAFVTVEYRGEPVVAA